MGRDHSPGCFRDFKAFCFVIGPQCVARASFELPSPSLPGTASASKVLRLQVWLAMLSVEGRLSCDNTGSSLATVDMRYVTRTGEEGAPALSSRSARLLCHLNLRVKFHPVMHTHMLTTEKSAQDYNIGLSGSRKAHSSLQDPKK